MDYIVVLPLFVTFALTAEAKRIQALMRSRFWWYVTKRVRRCECFRVIEVTNVAITPFFLVTLPPLRHDVANIVAIHSRSVLTRADFLCEGGQCCQSPHLLL